MFQSGVEQFISGPERGRLMLKVPAYGGFGLRTGESGIAQSSALIGKLSDARSKSLLIRHNEHRSRCPLDFTDVSANTERPRLPTPPKACLSPGFVLIEEANSPLKEFETGHYSGAAALLNTPPG